MSKARAADSERLEAPRGSRTDRKTGSQLRPAAERRLPRKIEREFANIVGGAGPNGALGSVPGCETPLAVCVQGLESGSACSWREREKEEEVDRSASEFVVFLSRESGSPVGLSRRTGRSRDSNALGIGLLSDSRLLPTLRSINKFYYRGINFARCCLSDVRVTREVVRESIDSGKRQAVSNTSRSRIDERAMRENAWQQRWNASSSARCMSMRLEFSCEILPTHVRMLIRPVLRSVVSRSRPTIAIIVIE